MSRTTATVLELNTAARAAIKALRDSKPWKGTRDERAEKFSEFHRSWCRAYDLETMLVRDDRACDPEGTSANSSFNPFRNRILLTGRLSVVTHLFLLACATGASPRDSMKFAHAQFRHFFPRSFARCVLQGGLLVKVS